MTYKPDGYTALAPYLVVDDVRAAIDFLVTVFDAVPLRRIERDDGQLGHGEARIDDTVVMFGGAMEGWPAVPAHVHVYVRDVDATWQRALDAGASAVQEPVRKDDVDRRGGFRDAWGTTWWIAQQME